MSKEMVTAKDSKEKKSVANFSEYKFSECELNLLYRFLAIEPISKL